MNVMKNHTDPPIVEVATPKVYANPNDREVYLECIVHGEPVPRVRTADASGSTLVPV